MCTSCGVSCSSGSRVASRMAVWSGVRPCHSDSSSTSRCVELRRRTNASSSSARFSSAASASAITWRREESVNIFPNDHTDHYCSQVITKWHREFHIFLHNLKEFTVFLMDCCAVKITLASLYMKKERLV